MLTTAPLLLTLCAPPLVQLPSNGEPVLIQLSAEGAIEVIGLWLDSAEKAGTTAAKLEDAASALELWLAPESPYPFDSGSIDTHLEDYALTLADWPLVGTQLEVLGIESLGPHTVLFPAFTSGTAVVDLPGLRFDDLVAPGGLPPVEGGPTHSALLGLATDHAESIRADLADALRMIKSGHPVPYVPPSSVAHVDVPWPVALDRCRRRARAAQRLEDYYDLLRESVAAAPWIVYEFEPQRPEHLAALEHLSGATRLPQVEAEAPDIVKLQAEVDALVDFLIDHTASVRGHGLELLTGAPLGATTPPVFPSEKVALPYHPLTPKFFKTDELNLGGSNGYTNALAALDFALDSVHGATAIAFDVQQTVLDIVSPNH